MNTGDASQQAKKARCSVLPYKPGCLLWLVSVIVSFWGMICVYVSWLPIIYTVAHMCLKMSGVDLDFYMYIYIHIHIHICRRTY